MSTSPQRRTSKGIQSRNCSDNIQTWVSDLFGGVMQSITQCCECETKSTREEPFFDLSVDVSPNISISECLKNYAKTELLSSQDKFFCEECGCKQLAKKYLKVKQLPRTLIIHLKRFKYSERLGQYQKLNHRVPFPLQIRIENERTVEARRTQFSKSEIYEENKEMNLNSTFSKKRKESDTETKVIRQSPLYRLSGIIVHLGQGLSYGHYIALIRSHDFWVKYDDHQVSLADEKLLSMIYGCSNDDTYSTWACAYMLFYERLTV